MSAAARKRVAKMKGKYRDCPVHGKVKATAWGAHMRYQHPAKKPRLISPKSLQQLILVGVTQSDVVVKAEGREIPIASFMHSGKAEDLARLLRGAFAGRPPGNGR